MVQDMNWNFEIGYVLGTNHFEIKVCNQQSYEQSAGKFSNKMCIQEIVYVRKSFWRENSRYCIS